MDTHSHIPRCDSLRSRRRRSDCSHSQSHPDSFPLPRRTDEPRYTSSRSNHPPSPRVLPDITQVIIIIIGASPGCYSCCLHRPALCHSPGQCYSRPHPPRTSWHHFWRSNGHHRGICKGIFCQSQDIQETNLISKLSTTLRSVMMVTAVSPGYGSSRNARLASEHDMDTLSKL